MMNAIYSNGWIDFAITNLLEPNYLSLTIL